MGMPSFETVDFAKLAELFAGYDDFNTLTLPDFTRRRMRSHIVIKEAARHLKHLFPAFPAHKHDDVKY